MGTKLFASASAVHGGEGISLTWSIDRNVTDESGHSVSRANLVQWSCSGGSFSDSLNGVELAQCANNSSCYWIAPMNSSSQFDISCSITATPTSIIADEPECEVLIVVYGSGQATDADGNWIIDYGGGGANDGEEYGNDPPYDPPGGGSGDVEDT